MLDLLDIGGLLRTNRKALGLSQHELASRTGLSRALIAKLELGRLPEIGIKKLQRLLNAVGLDLRVAAYNHQRPTLEDLLADEESAHDPTVGRAILLAREV